MSYVGELATLTKTGNSPPPETLTSNPIETRRSTIRMTASVADAISIDVFRKLVRRYVDSGSRSVLMNVIRDLSG